MHGDRLDPTLLADGGGFVFFCPGYSRWCLWFNKSCSIPMMMKLFCIQNGGGADVSAPR